MYPIIIHIISYVILFRRIRGNRLMPEGILAERFKTHDAINFIKPKNFKSR
jgi:hypothetical protein